jgi:hypothetical protein
MLNNARVDLECGIIFMCGMCSICNYFIQLGSPKVREKRCWYDPWRHFNIWEVPKGVRRADGEAKN